MAYFAKFTERGQRALLAAQQEEMSAKIDELTLSQDTGWTDV